jgi:hypothetical protein
MPPNTPKRLSTPRSRSAASAIRPHASRTFGRHSLRQIRRAWRIARSSVKNQSSGSSLQGTYGRSVSEVLVVPDDGAGLR